MLAPKPSCSARLAPVRARRAHGAKNRPCTSVVAVRLSGAVTERGAPWIGDLGLVTAARAACRPVEAVRVIRLEGRRADLLRISRKADGMANMRELSMRYASPAIEEHLLDRARLRDFLDLFPFDPGPTIV